MSWYYYPKSTPRAVKDGIKVKSKRGAIGEQWWSKRFLNALHQMGMDSRLARGRNYARKGQVSALKFSSGGAHAILQGSMPRPYEVEIQLKPWSTQQWEAVLQEISSQALYAAELLAGEMPHEIEQIVRLAGVNLFPERSTDITTVCDCPDYANPCKHIAAVYYILAERFDTDPFLIFVMRGKDKETFLDDLRILRGAEEPEHLPDDTLGQDASIPDDIDAEPLTASGFFSLKIPLDDFKVHLTAGPEVKGAILKRLGPSPFTIGKKNLTDLIAPVYEFAPEYVQKMVHGSDHEKKGGK
jgi:uncharacterized Zn finger protein